MQLPNQRLRKLDKLSHDACSPDKLTHNAMQNTLNQKGLQSPKCSDKLSCIKQDTQDKLSCIKQNTYNCYVRQYSLIG